MSLRPPKVGVLPLYLALYEEAGPELRLDMETFARLVVERLQAQGLEVVLTRTCWLRQQVEAQVAALTAAEVDLLATLHLSYSPSLEAVEALQAAPLPLLLLDTTPNPRFADHVNREELIRNHAIHGVQDLASVLRRVGRRYELVVGYVPSSDFLEAVIEVARAAQITRALRTMRVLALGEPFSGMGDFQVEASLLEKLLGVHTERVEVDALGSYLAQVSAGDVIGENAEDMARYDCAGLVPERLTDSNRVGLAVRAMLADMGAGAFTANFTEFDVALGLHTYPFLEASKAMERGVGYAGEGDVLTAALVGALLQGFREVTFCEMFCPDWAENWILMSHMGECNLAMANQKPRLVEKALALGPLENPVVPIFPLRAGPATLVNLAPAPGDTLSIIVSPVQILARALEPGLPDSPHFWIRREDRVLPDFLGDFSELGGTHHSALISGEHVGVIKRMAHMLGLACHEI